MGEALSSIVRTEGRGLGACVEVPLIKGLWRLARSWESGSLGNLGLESQPESGSLSWGGVLDLALEAPTPQ